MSQDGRSQGGAANTTEGRPRGGDRPSVRPRPETHRERARVRGRGPSSAEVVAEGVGALRVAQLGHRLPLDLADPLAGQTELLADLLQRPGLAAVEAEAKRDLVALPLLQR